MKIVFFGTPDFAVYSLRAIHLAGYNVVAVITAADKPAGRGRQMRESPVKKYASENGLLVIQPVRLKDPLFLQELKKLEADLQVVVAFRMLPEVVWAMPRLGTINVHASLLPDYRGAAPINHVIINGETETGVTTFRLKHEIDTGDILLKKSVAIHSDETAGTLHDKLMKVGADLLLDTLHSVASAQIEGQKQEEIKDLHHAPKLSKEFCQINWQLPVQKIDSFVRGLSPYPAAFTTFEGKQLKIFAGILEAGNPVQKTGTYHTDGKTFLKFVAADGYYAATDVQYEGKKRMGIEELLRGLRMAPNM